ncbi:acyl-CoA N-acyltransferase [Coniochaeta sp. 2T2.1]|nr:acyl-CoA N-acyltransferase [Coniochaeta sp. 2T2.1]
MSWRNMLPEDIPSVLSIASSVHPDLPEDASIFAERLDLFPEGCLVLVSPNSPEQVYGYAISHPILKHQPPALNALLGEIHPKADQYYIHDVAVLPSFRDRGLARGCVDRLLAVATGYGFPNTCLVSVYGAARFWARFGFAVKSAEKKQEEQRLREKLRGYGGDAEFMERRN